MAAALVWVCSLPMWMRLLIIGTVLSGGGLSVVRLALLTGPRAMRALEWKAGAGCYGLFLGPGLRPVEGELDGCRQFGGLWQLRFRTPEGMVDALVDSGQQDPRAMRRLAGRLLRPSAGSSGPVPAAGRSQAATIAEKGRQGLKCITRR